MDARLRDEFLALWSEFFGPAELPICLYYRDTPAGPVPPRPAGGHACLIGQLAAVRRGQDLCVNADALGCPGAKRYLGFTCETMPNFEHFLSRGIPGKLEGERYKKTPQVVLEAMKQATAFTAPAPYAVFKRWDKLETPDQPQVVIFFATPDVLAGLFTLSGFPEADPYAVITPFGAGCATIAQYPYLEGASDRPRSVIGMMDVSARPLVPPDVLSFATPMKKFAAMIADMRESFLVTASWAKVRHRIQSVAQKKTQD